MGFAGQLGALQDVTHIEERFHDFICNAFLALETKRFSWHDLTSALPSSLMKREFGTVVGIHGDGRRR